MNFQPLVRSPESQMSELYRCYQIDEVAYQYLFRGRSYSWLDEHLLYQNSEETHGFHSKGILLSLGLREHHQNVFKGLSIGKAMGILKTVSGSEQIVAILERYQAGNNRTDLGAYNLSSGGREFQAPELKKGKRVPLWLYFLIPLIMGALFLIAGVYHSL